MARKPVKSLEREEKEQYYFALEEKLRRVKTRKIYRMYPETGPLSRHAYKKHMLFMKMGKTYKERAVIAANRVGKCLTRRTLIDTDRGPVALGDLFDAGRPFKVWAYDVETGERRLQWASAPFKKEGAHECFRIELSDGQWIEAADDHRLLTSAGWRFVRDLALSPADTRLLSPVFRFLTSLVFGLSGSRAGGGRSFGIPPDYPGGCSGGPRRDDGQLRQGGEGALAFLQRIVGALLRIGILSHAGGPGGTDTGTPSQCGRPLSTPYAPFPVVDRVFAWINRVLCNAALPCPGVPQVFQRSFCAAISLFRQGASRCLGLFGFFSALNSSLIKVADSRVVSFYSIGRKEVFDFEVKNSVYCAGGLVHHNTEGMGAYELVWHLTGLYPDWWEGHRFDRAIKSWAAGTTNQKTKEILQDKLLGPLTDVGTGLIPGDLIADYKRKTSTVPDVIETILVRHVSGDLSVLVLKSFEQGRIAFEGTEQDVILLDEEPPEDVYTECVMRTMTTQGLVLLTFTPLQGMSSVVQKFMPGGVPMEGEIDGRYLVCATWDDAPHLSEEDKKRLWLSLPPHQRDARSKGIPSLGSGAIYPILEGDITVDDFPLPAHWPRGYSLDVGWNCTAALWGAQDPETGVVYLTSCYKRGVAEPEVHVAAIKARGDWMFGASDPAARIGSQKDGDNLLDIYRKLGLKLIKADNSVESGVFDVWTMLSTGKLKVFRSLTPWFEEFRLYRRDEKGRIVKENDHLMDDTRYLIRTGVKIFRTMPLPDLAARFDKGTSNYDLLRSGL